MTARADRFAEQSAITSSTDTNCVVTPEVRSAGQSFSSAEAAEGHHHN